MIDSSRTIHCAKNSAVTAAITALSVLAMIVLRAGLDRLFREKSHFNWIPALEAFAVIGAICFAIYFVWNLIAVLRADPALEILEDEAPEQGLLPQPLSGFVAMEYYRLILNRTFVTFIAPEGLYGWKARGVVTNADRNFYEPYEEMLEDKEFLRDRKAIEKLSQLRGGFFLERSTIASVEADSRQKWGMGGIPHSGRIHVRFLSGQSREFILLGSVDAEGIRDAIVTVLGAQVTSDV